MSKLYVNTTGYDGINYEVKDNIYMCIINILTIPEN